MSVQVKRWIQREWKRAGVSLWQKDGDFYQLSQLEPSTQRDQLQRVPIWSGRVRIDTNGLHSIRGMFYDEANSRYVLLGNDTASGDLAASYLSSAWGLSALTVLHTTPTNLGGLSLRDYAYYGGKLWLVGSDGKVYAGTAYTAALTEFDADTTHRIICPIDERIYVVHSTGAVDRTNDAADALEAYFTPDHAMDIRFMAGYRGYALLVARDLAGALHFLRLPLNHPAPKLSLLATLTDRGTEPTWGLLYCMHDDDLYFSPGHFTSHGQQNALNLYRFNGSRIERVLRHDHPPNTGATGFPTSAGLLSWQGKLIYYALEGSTSQIFKCLLGDTMFEHAQLAQSVNGLPSPIAISAGNRLICTATDGVDEHVCYLQEYILGDGYVITPWLDMGYPDRKKRLLRITCLLDGSAANFNLILKYKCDADADWTTLTTMANNRRVSADLATIKEFFTMQLRIDVDDNTAANPDYRIDAVAVTYSVDV